ncbi:MAG: cytochrome c family protein [bacterium]|nr:cytochrome c family protein [bacterium]
MKRLTPTTALLFLLGLGTVVATTTQCTDRATGQHASTPAGPGKAGAPTPGSHAAPQDPAGAAGDRIKLLVSGSMLGRLEPCGCASGQLGGLPRRMQHIGEQRDYDLLLEGGNLVAGSSLLDLAKASTMLLVLFQMQHPYHALGVGKNDLELPMDDWLEYLQMAPTVASDLETDLETWPGVPFVEHEVRGQKIRVASFTHELPAAPETGDAQPKAAPFRLLGADRAWPRAMAGVADATLRILMFHGPDTAARALIPTLSPRPDLVVCFDQSYSEPTAQPETVDGTPLVFPGIRGRVMLELTLARGDDGPSLGYRHVPLPASKTIPGGGGDPDVKQMLLMHREDVASQKLLQALANRKPTPNGAEYVGSQTCSACHQEAYKAWKASKHGHAWQTLVDAEKDPKRYGWPVTKYPDCVACHVVGYGDQSGFVDMQQTPLLADVGCERCHGPGSKHVTGPASNPLGIIGGLPKSQLCVQCHDFEQSPDFLYGTEWAKIQHGRESHWPKKAAGGK